jgi:hypothetical protein
VGTAIYALEGRTLTVTALTELQVTGEVVLSVAIDVVNRLGICERAPQFVGHHDPMLWGVAGPSALSEAMQKNGSSG